MSTSDYASTPDNARRERRPTSPPGSTGELEALQHMAGNRAVGALIQAKLQVGAVDDPLEREADRVAKRVVSGAHGHEGPACADCSPAASATVDTAIRRSGSGGGAAGGDLDTQADTAIRQASGRGRALDPDVQRSMEAGFGVDFSGVSVHVDAEADGLNRQLGARAFTTGSDIFFRQGEYAPETAGGKELLAHELTHVVQQGAAGSGGDEAVHRSPDPATIQRKAYRIGRSDEKLEVEPSVSKKDREALLKEAKAILAEVKSSYGVKVSSKTTVKGIKNEYTDVPKKVLKTLTTRAWKIEELRALSRALGYYSAILGANRATSTRSGEDQEVTSVGKVDQAIDEDTPAGKLDTSTLGEYFESKKNMGLFKASERYVSDFDNLGDQLTGTFVHEIAHGLLSYALPDYITATGYWEDEDDALPVSERLEDPITNYGKVSPAEDLCEAAMMYFVAPQRLRTACPRRYAFMVKIGTDWVPAPSEAPQVQPEAKGEAPGTGTPDSESTPQLDRVVAEIEQVVAKVESRAPEPPDDAPDESVEAPVPDTTTDLVGKPT